jgi:hypothetical protein
MPPKALFRLSALCLFAGACGCSHNPTHAELAQVYRTGMTRGEAANALGEPMRIETRPDAGWRRDEKTVERVGAFASHFEQSHGAVVQTCEVYRVPRGFTAMGIWWDYLFFGPDDNLLGFQRRFVD